MSINFFFLKKMCRQLFKIKNHRHPPKQKVNFLRSLSVTYGWLIGFVFGYLHNKSDHKHLSFDESSIKPITEPRLYIA